jgi:hypothetical protein
MRIQLSTKALILDDPDVDEIEIKVTLKDGKKTEDISSIALERAILRFVGSNIPTYLDYVIRYKQRTYGKSPEPIYVDDSTAGQS